MSELIGLYGTGGCARGLMPLLRDQVSGSSTELVFVDDASESVSNMNGHAVLSWEDFSSAGPRNRSVCIGIASPLVRSKLTEKVQLAGFKLHEIRAANVVVMDNVEIGEGACLSPFVTLTSNIKIGRGFHANLYAYVEHDCIIGDFVTFAPGAKCNGNVHIGDHAYIGSNCVIRQGNPDRPMLIGKGATIGMGAVVTKNVPDGAVVMGNPARLFKR